MVHMDHIWKYLLLWWFHMLQQAGLSCGFFWQAAGVFATTLATGNGRQNVNQLTNAFNAPTIGCKKATQFLEAELQKKRLKKKAIAESLSIFLWKIMKVKCGQESFRMLERHQINVHAGIHFNILSWPIWKVSTHTFAQSTKSWCNWNHWHCSITEARRNFSSGAFW